MCLGHARHDESAATVDSARVFRAHAIAIPRYPGNATVFDQDFADIRVSARAVENIDVGENGSVHVSSDR
jgi:hypothetical protein